MAARCSGPTWISSRSSRAQLPELGKRGGKIGFQAHTGTVRFRNIELKELPPAADSLQPGSVWVAEPGNSLFTILERQGERFKARFEVGRQVREVNGTIKDGRLRWLAGNVKAISGNPGGDNEGEIRGDEVAMTWSNPGGPIRGRFTFRLKERATAGPAAGLRYPADAREFRGKRYKVFPQQLTWHEARVKCQESGGHLAVVTSRAEPVPDVLGARERSRRGAGSARRTRKSKGDGSGSTGPRCATPTGTSRRSNPTTSKGSNITWPS